MAEIFTGEECAIAHRVIHARRDMRHFTAGAHVKANILQRLLEAAHAAPSVGFMQPWRFIRITRPKLRQQLASMVEEERQKTAGKMNKRKAEFLKLKIEGVRDCAELLAVVLAPDDGTVLGRRTMPEEMALCSAACAIQNMWLAARAENLGMGWVSFFDPDDVIRLLDCPEGARPIALICLGPVKEFYPEPMLQAAGWRGRQPLETVLAENQYPADIKATDKQY